MPDHPNDSAEGFFAVKCKQCWGGVTASREACERFAANHGERTGHPVGPVVAARDPREGHHG